MVFTKDTTIKLTRRNIRTHIGGLARVLTLDGFRKVDLMVYGGCALILASNFREETWDLDAFIYNAAGFPVKRENRELFADALRLENAADNYADGTQMGRGWLDNSIYTVFEGSPLDLKAKEGHIFIETIPHDPPIFDIYVPDKSLMLAMKVKAMRIYEDEKGKPKDLNDLRNLLALPPEIKNDHELIEFSAKFFPDIKESKKSVEGAKELFTTFAGTAHPSPRYLNGSHPEP